MAIIIFDLDGTVIDSSHRYRAKPCGDIDLKAWFDMATPELIAKDGLLPLVRAMRRFYQAGHTIVIATARCMKQADLDFLENNDIPHHYLLSRQGYFVHEGHEEYPQSYHGFIGDARGDGEMKIAMVQELFDDLGLGRICDNNVLLFEDNQGVIREFMKHDVQCFDAIRANKKMAPLERKAA